VSYRIEITADTLAELAGKAASLAAKLNTGTATEAPSNPIMPELREVAEVAPVDPTPAPKSAPVVEAYESQPTTEEPSSTPAPATLDYKTEVAPLVLKLVEVSGKPAAQRVLDQFGAAKASDISPDLWPELVAIIKAEMGQ
jgi:hypothetical protein